MSFTKINHYEKEYADTHHDTALNVTEGVEDQPIVSPYFTRRKKRRLSTDEYVEGILAGNITTLSQAITLVESNNPAHYAQAQQIIERCLPHAGKSVRIGITGVPGAGKSTFIEAIGNMVTSLRHKLAVLAIDPSSERSVYGHVFAEPFVHTFELGIAETYQFVVYHHTVQDITFPDKISNKGILWFIINLFWCSNLLNLAF